MSHTPRRSGRSRPRQAIILAAGQGVRLRATVDDRPKGLIEIRGETLVGRSIRLLRAHGVTRMTVVAGYRAEQYQQLAQRDGDVEILINDRFATTGTMTSLLVALDAKPSDEVLVLESDIIYEPRALAAIVESPATTSTLVSGPTAAGDEVWVDAVANRLRAMSKDRRRLSTVVGEFVGITRLSREAADAMRRCRAQRDYETGGLVAIAEQHHVATIVVDDLQWGEIDDEQQYARVASMLWRG
jgi:2-aminoethylphosphonate-pyruvate transaminase